MAKVRATNGEEVDFNLLRVEADLTRNGVKMDKIIRRRKISPVQIQSPVLDKLPNEGILINAKPTSN